MFIPLENSHFPTTPVLCEHDPAPAEDEFMHVRFDEWGLSDRPLPAPDQSFRRRRPVVLSSELSGPSAVLGQPRRWSSRLPNSCDAMVFFKT